MKHLVLIKSNYNQVQKIVKEWNYETPEFEDDQDKPLLPDEELEQPSEQPTQNPIPVLNQEEINTMERIMSKVRQSQAGGSKDSGSVVSASLLEPETHLHQESEDMFEDSEKK